MTVNITPNVLRALKEIESDFEGLSHITLQMAAQHQPKGRRQDCDLPALGCCEWVDQTQIGEDSFVGTVTWIVDGVMIVAGYSL